MEKYMIIDGERVSFTDEKNILAVIRKAGIILPTFCYYSDLSIYGACRMCVVEDKWGGIVASCSTPPKHEMEIYTNTPQLYYHRKRILELLLAAHCRDCTTCEKNGKCKLQELAKRFGIPGVRFENTNPIRPIDRSSKAIVKDPNKCILCGDCVRVCNEIQHVGAIDFANRGSKMIISTAFGRDLADTNCVNCGQCAAVCPTGAITIKNDTHDVEGRKYPLFTSCCPGWIRFVETKYPHLMKYVSTSKSPMEMFGAVIKEYYKKLDKEEGKETVSVAIMPCTAKKYEASREEFVRNSRPDVDYVLTSEEVIGMFKEIGIRFDRLEPEAYDMPFSIYSGAGVIFGATGGVTEAAVRRVVADKSPKALKDIEFIGTRGMAGTKICELDLGERTVRIGIVSGLGNAEELIKKIESGEEHFDFVEVMACPGGCVAGAGQPFARSTEKRLRAEGLYKNDKALQIKRSENNPIVKNLYDDLLKNREHELLHVHYPGHKADA